MIQDREPREQEAESCLGLACLGRGSVLEGAQPRLDLHLEGLAGTWLELEGHLDCLAGWLLRILLKVTLCQFRVHSVVAKVVRLQQGQVLEWGLQVRLGEVEGSVLRLPLTRQGQPGWRATLVSD